MPLNPKNNENDLNELYNRLKNMDRKKVDELKIIRNSIITYWSLRM